MNWANRLTVARLFFTFIFVVALTTDWAFGKTVGLFLFLLAGITDYADGKIARHFNMITDFGKLMDPLVDKIMIAAAFICLVPLNAIPAWAVIIVISREFLITGLRMLALSKGKVLPAESMGKHKTAWQIITVIYFLGVLSLREIRNERGPAARLLVLLRLPLGLRRRRADHLRAGIHPLFRLRLPVEKSCATAH